MNKIILAAAAVLALSGSSFAANTDHQSTDVSQPQALNQQLQGIDRSTTASIGNSATVTLKRPTAADVQQGREVGNPNEY